METNDKLQNFLSSVALVIDDEIEKKGSTIVGIIQKLEEEGAIFVKYRELIENTQALSNIGFIILDWDLTKEEEKVELPEGVLKGVALTESQKDNIKQFVKQIIEQYFIPIFIFSRENIDLIKTYLQDESVINEAINKGRVFLKNKSDLSGEQIISELNTWLNQSMSVYTFKVMEEAISKAKHKYFNEMYQCNPDWPCCVYKNLSEDNPADINSDFQEFLMTSFTSTIEPILFNNDGFRKEANLSEDDKLKIYSKIKFLEYKNCDSIGPHAGDLYLGTDGQYYLNVSASCDMRKKRYYFVHGQATSHPERRKNINECVIRNLYNKKAVFFELNKAKILENVLDCNSIIIEGVAFLRIGRLLEPYISDIQKKYSFYITRTGVFVEPND